MANYSYPGVLASTGWLARIGERGVQDQAINVVGPQVARRGLKRLRHLLRRRRARVIGDLPRVLAR